MPQQRLNIHATALVFEGFGLLIRGPSGAGKSLLALELLAENADARLVADDRLDLERAGNGLVMHTPANIAGLIELRGRGIIERPHLPAAPLHLVVDLVEGLVRMPDKAAFSTILLEISIPACPVPMRGIVDSAHQRLLVRQGLAELVARSRPQAQFNT